MNTVEIYEGETMFQFHKVRLKELREAEAGKIELFQFHKVRLKVAIGKQPAWIEYSFNSIRYD